MNYSVTVKNYLMSDIDAMASTPEAYALNPGKDFTRHRKISFKDLILLPITMEAGTMRHELYKYFNYQNLSILRALFYSIIMLHPNFNDETLRNNLIIFQQHTFFPLN